MNIKIQFKENLRWSTQTIGQDRLSSCLAILSNNMKTEQRQKLHSGYKKQLILSEYYIRETNDRSKKPCVIGIEPDSESTGIFYLYEIKYNMDRNVIFLANKEEWEYCPYMGSKKEGWQIIDLEYLGLYVDVVVDDWKIYDTIIRMRREEK